MQTLRRPRRQTPAVEDPRAARVAGEASAAAAAELEASLEVPPDTTAAAFFDVDNTLLRGASIFHLARGLYARGYFSRRDIARFGWQQAKFRLVGAESPADIAAAQQQALAFIAGRTVEELTGIAEEVFDAVVAEKTWPGTLAYARLHLDAGERVWLVTATPVEVASSIARRLGLTGALGTVAESVDGVYTGRLVGEPLHGRAKAEAVRALASREGLDLSRCAAYSDSANDIPLLSLVGEPCAINPDAALRSHARTNGWRLQDYRRGRTAARVGLPAVAVLGAAAGAVGAGRAVRRRPAEG